MSILKLRFTFIAILVSQVFAIEWTQDDSNFISSERLIIKFEKAPELGIELPLELKSRTKIRFYIKKLQKKYIFCIK